MIEPAEISEKAPQRSRKGLRTSNAEDETAVCRYFGLGPVYAGL